MNFMKNQRSENCTISPLYQYIHDFSSDTALSGAGDASWFEPVLSQFGKLIEVFI